MRTGQMIQKWRIDKEKDILCVHCDPTNVDTAATNVKKLLEEGVFSKSIKVLKLKGTTFDEFQQAFGGEESLNLYFPIQTVHSTGSHGYFVKRNGNKDPRYPLHSIIE